MRTDTGATPGPEEGDASLDARGGEDLEALRDSVERLRHVFAYAPIGMAVVELDGKWRQVNAALVRLLGYSEARLLAGTFQDITHPDDLDADLEQLRSLLAGDIDSYEMEKRYLTASGRTVWALLSVTLVRDDRDEPLYFISQIQDTTQRKAQEQALRDLVAMLSHDLRSPISVVIGYADILSTSWGELADAERDALLQKITTASRAVQTLLDDTLTVSAINAQGVAARPVRVRVDTVVREAAAALGPDVDVSGVRPATALVDPTHLAQVVANLLGNALKYGAAPVRVDLDDDGGAASGKVTLRVCDAGPGVPADFVPHLFDRFTRSEEVRLAGTPGTGLGLYITRQLLEVNDGSVTHEDTPGGGATFVVRLPRAD